MQYKHKKVSLCKTWVMYPHSAFEFPLISLSLRICCKFVHFLISTIAKEMYCRHGGIIWKKTPTHPQKWSVGPRKWLADLSSSSHPSFTYSFFFFFFGYVPTTVPLNFHLYRVQVHVYNYNYLRDYIILYCYNNGYHLEEKDKMHNTIRGKEGQ